MIIRGRKALRIVGYVSFGLVALGGSFCLRFPTEAIGQRLAHELQRETNGTWSVSFDDLSLYWLSGLKARGVHLRASREGAPPATLDFDAVHVRLRLLPLLWLGRTLDAGVELGGGQLDASLSLKSESADVNAQIEDFSLAGPVSQLVGVPISGLVSGKLEAKLAYGSTPGYASPAARPAMPGRAPPPPPPTAPADKSVAFERSEGSGSLAIQQARLGPGTVSGVGVPSLGLGDLAMTFELKTGRLRLATFQQKGGQLALRSAASLILQRRVSASTLDACLQLRVSDPALLERNPNLKAALQLAEIQVKKDNEGYLNVPLRGRIGDPASHLFKSSLCTALPAR